MSSRKISSVHISRRKPLAACVAAIFALSGSAAVHAATYFVTTCDDSGPNTGTLRLAASQAANNDVIDMTGLSASSPSCNGTAEGFAAFMTVNSTVTIAGGVTINGPGKNAFAVSGLTQTGTGPIFSSAGALTINNLGVKYRSRYISGSAALGGCIRTGGDLTLTNVKALSCNANSGSSLARGGAAYASGALTATGSDFVNSYVYTKSGLAGGGAVFGKASVSLTNSNVTCHSYGSSSNCTNTHATSATGSAYGGALDTFGSVYVNGGEISGQALVTGTTGGRVSGGVIFGTSTVYVKGGAELYGKASTQSTGSAQGGGIYAGSGVTVEGSSFIEFSTAYSKSGPSYGGGIFTNGGTSYIKYSALIDNVASRGGAVYARGDEVKVKYSVLADNYAVNGGGAIITRAGNTIIQGSSIFNNSGEGWNAVDHNAAGTTTVTIENSTISGNASVLSEPSVYAFAYRTVIDNSTIVYNKTHGTAAVFAGVYVKPSKAGSTLDLNSTLISSNTNDAGNDDLFVPGAASGLTFTATSGHNLVRSPGGGVPTDTIVGKCPQLHPLSYAGVGFIYVFRPAIKSPEVDAGSNPLNLKADQRGDSISATSPPRASGPGPNNASPKPDIGAYEVDQNDIVFDAEFETCT
jgi:hypothetical protein